MGWAALVFQGISAIPGLIRTGKEIVKEFASVRPKPPEVPPPSIGGAANYVRGMADAKDAQHQKELDKKLTDATMENLSPWNPDGSPKE
jgi:hypothetical protein